MCYNSEMSFAFATIGVATLAYIYAYKKSLTYSGIQYVLLFYILMETLQGIQYFFVNQCSNMVNILLTEVAYILVLTQPLMWNLFYYFNSDPGDKKIFLVAIASFIVWMISDVSARIMYNKTDLNKTQETGFYASDKVCTKKEKTHLYWQWTSANFRELNANGLCCFILWFIPALFSKKFRSTSLLMMGLSAFAASIAYFNNEFFTYASLWCYISVPIMLLIIFDFTFFKK